MKYPLFLSLLVVFGMSSTAFGEDLTDRVSRPSLVCLDQLEPVSFVGIKARPLLPGRFVSPKLILNHPGRSSVESVAWISSEGKSRIITTAAAEEKDGSVTDDSVRIFSPEGV